MRLSNLLTLLVVCFSVFVTSNACRQVGWARKMPKCSAGETEIYMDSASDHYSKICCPTGSAAAKKYKSRATMCRATKCLSISTSNLCGTLDERTVDGKKLEYEDVMRDTCSMKDGGGTGIVALCCVKGSLESALVTTMGAEPNEFPHQAKLKIGNGNCGGTIYNKKFIVTAAHCIVSNHVLRDAKTMKAILGTNIADMESEEYVYNVKRAIPHEQYSKMEGHPELQEDNPMTYNDIALLELEKEIKFSDKIKSLEIAPKGFDPFKYADSTAAVGWGTMENQASSVNMQKTNFLLRSDDTCFAYSNEAAWPSKTLNKHQKQLLCVGGIRDGKWSPTAGGGDSGGPAICRAADGKIVLCGVTSFGGSDEECAANNDEESCKSSVYADVGFFHNFFKKHAGSQDSSTFYKPFLYGETVPPGKYDHQVRITSKTGKSCGGTLVAPDIVVTAAHCIMKPNGKTYSGVKITHGLRDLKGGGSGKTFGVKTAGKYPSFARTGEELDIEKQGNRVTIADAFYKDDLAVVKLDGKVPVDSSMLPILPEFQDTFHQASEIAFPRNTTISGQLRSREFRLLDMDDCQARMNRMAGVGVDIKVDRNLLCGVEKYSGGSRCDRELGGGLICKKGGKDVLCGVQVFRLCEFTIPNGFLNMALYSGFVKSAVEQLNNV